MEINWVIMGIVLFFVLILIVLLIWKNQKDEKKFKEFLNKDYKKTIEQDSDLDDETY